MYEDDVDDEGELFTAFGSDDDPDTEIEVTPATRGLSESALFEGAEFARFTPLYALAQQVATLRLSEGPANPMINDLCEEIQSELMTIILSIRSDPEKFIRQIASSGQVQ